MQFCAITYLKIVPYLSRSILGLGETECHTGNYICALQEKEKYHNTGKPLKGKVGGTERTRDREREKHTKDKLWPLFDYKVMIGGLMGNIFLCFLVILHTSSR